MSAPAGDGNNGRAPGPNGCRHQMLDLPKVTKIKIAGWIKSQGSGKVTFAAQFFDEKYTWNELVPLANLDTAQDWTQAEKEIEVPASATRVALALYVEGQACAWLDDVTLSATGAKVKVETASRSDKAPKEPKNTKLIPTTPAPGYYPDFPDAWMAFHDSLVKRAKEGNVEVLFLGDSFTQGWSTTGREYWDQHFAPLQAANFGIGGDKTGNVLWRIEKGELDGIRPKVVVLLIGVNNLWSGVNTAEEIGGGVRAIVEKIRTKLPETKVLVLGLLPMDPEPGSFNRFRGAQINPHLAKLDDGANVRYANLSSRFLQKTGAFLPGIYAADNVHLTSKGYEILARELLPLVTAMSKESATVPGAVPVPAAR